MSFSVRGFRLGGEWIHCSFDPALEWVIDALVEDQPLDTAGIPRVHLVLEQTAVPVSKPTAEAWAPSCFFGDVLGFSSQGAFALWDQHSISEVSADGTQVRVKVHIASSSRAVSATLAYLGLAVALQSVPICLVHAGQLLAPYLGGVLVVGGSGAGKTTLSLALAEAGAQFGSDDSVLLRTALPGQVTAYPWPRRLHVSPRTLQAFPRVATCGERVYEGAPKFVAHWDCPPPRMVEPVAPRVILFPRVAPVATSSVSQLSGQLAFQELLHSSALLALFPERAKALFLLVSQVNRQSSAYRVTLGRDLLENPGSAAARILEHL